MAAIIVDIADAVAEELEAASAADYFGPLTISPVRSYAAFDDKLESQTTHRVDVVPLKAEMRQASRGHLVYEVSVSVLIRKLFGAADRNTDGTLKNSSVDAMVLLLQRCYEWFAPSYPGNSGRSLTSQPLAAWLPPDGNDGSQFKAFYSRQMLRVNSQFSGWAVLSYMIPKQGEQRP